MSGPEFLLFYAALLLVTFVGLRWFNRWRDPRAGEALPPVPSPADPYELAWLRGGATEVIRLAVYDLMQSGHLESTRDASTRGPAHLLATPRSEPSGLAPLARVVLRACATPQKPADLMRGTLAEGVDVACSHWRLAHEEAGLLQSASQRTNGWLAVIFSLMVLVGITLMRIDYAYAHGHSNVWFLIALTGVAVMIAWSNRPSRRLTVRGVSYLQRLRSALAPSPAPRRITPSNNASNSDSTNVSDDTANSTSAPVWSPMTSAALVPIALYGMEAMAGHDQQQMRQLFPQAAQQPSTGCSAGGCGSASSCGAVESSSSSSSSSDSGGGDSGGGSGCGGGGD